MAVKTLTLTLTPTPTPSPTPHQVKTIADMLFQYCLQNRWVKAALTVTEVEAMLVRHTLVRRP